MLKRETSGVSEFGEVAVEFDVSEVVMEKRPRSMVCVTVYNEPLKQLTETLLSLLRSIRQAQINHIDAASEFCIVIIIDGLVDADVEVINFLQRSKMIDLAQGSQQKNRYFLSNIALEGLLEDKSVTTPYDRQSVPFIVSIKSNNLGKLDSHALFFGDLCPRYEPEYCFQIDVGTTVSPNSISNMLAFLDSKPQMASAASTVVISPKQACGEIVSDWQFMDFAIQAAVVWNAEILTGHLSVLPGQFSALRWRALSGKHKPDLSYVDFIELQNSSDSPAVKGKAPLKRYLRGLGVDSDIEKIMFLAEDRIIGNEIILADDKWQLGYCSEAYATTDACCDMPELLRQRRRWNNSSTACKLWLFTRWPDYLRRIDRSLTDKLRFSSAMIWQSLLIVYQLLMPAFVVCIAALGVQAITGLLESQHRFLFGLMLASAGAAGALSIPAVKQRYAKDPGLNIPWLRSLCLFIVSWILIYSLVLTLPLPALVFMMLPPVVATLLACLVFKRDWLKVLMKAPEFYVLVNPLMLATLWSYSIANLHDMTWGTKGLTKSKVSQSSKQGLNNVVLVMWLVLNAGVLYIAFSLPPVLFEGLNPCLELRFAIGAAMATFAVLLQVGKAYHSLSGVEENPSVNFVEKVNV